MTHQRIAGHVGDRDPRRSPDFEIRLAEIFRPLADSKNMM